MNAETVEISPKRRLPRLCEEAFLLILQLRAINEYGDTSLLRQRIFQLLDKLEQRGKQAGIAREDLQSAKFALTAFMDETILTSQWSQKDAWVEKTLGFELFQRMDAGEEFFRSLEELRRRSASNVELLEVYYLCLALGFKGKYMIYEQEKRRLLIKDLANELRTIRGNSSAPLSPRGKRREQIAEVVKKEVPAWIVAVGAGAVGFIFYLIMLWISRSEARAVMDALLKG